MVGEGSSHPIRSLKERFLNKKQKRETRTGTTRRQRGVVDIIRQETTKKETYRGHTTTEARVRNETVKTDIQEEEGRTTKRLGTERKIPKTILILI